MRCRDDGAVVVVHDVEDKCAVRIVGSGKARFSVMQEAHDEVVIPTVRILETMEEDATTDARRNAEAKWTMALNTVYPWGLNTNIKGCGAITDVSDPAERRLCPWFRYRYERPIQRGHKARENNMAYKTKERDPQKLLDIYKQHG